MPVRRASAKKTLVNNSPDLMHDPAFTQTLGMLLFGEANCEMVKPEPIESEEEDHGNSSRSGSSGWFIPKGRNSRSEKKPRPPKEKKSKPEKEEGTGFFSKVEGMFGGLFSEEDDE
jgi:cell division protein FtsA